MLKNCQKNILTSRVSPEAFDAVKAAVPDAVYHEIPCLALIERQPLLKDISVIAVCTGGTLDIYASKEASLTAESYGNRIRYCRHSPPV